MKNIPILLLLVILFAAAVLRLWGLGQVPPSPNWDEVALGYNAYSILQTGKDEYGTTLPLSLRSYDDYKPPLYMYLTVPSVALFGLSPWSVRFPAVISGLLAVIGTYFLTFELIQLSPTLSKKRYLPLLSCLLLALSPWHIQFSRIAFEAGIGVTITIWAATCFLLGLKKPQFLSWSAFLFALSLYAYHSQRIFVPLVVCLLGMTFWRILKKNRTGVVIAVIVGIMTVAPLIPVFTNPNTLTRLRGTSALSDQTRLLERTVKKLERDTTLQYLGGAIFDNRRFVYIQTLLTGYLSHYNPNWLFISGDNARHHAPGMGLLYLAELPFLVLGFFALARYGKKMAVLVLGWVIIAPVAASPTTELPHAIRTLVFLPMFQIIVALGIWHAKQLLRSLKPYVRKLLYIVCVCLAAFNILYYLDMYFIQQNHEYSRFWQYGYKQAVEYVVSHKSQYKKIVISTALEQPHMFFLFYLNYDPRKYLAEGGTASGGFAEVRNKFDIYEFRPIHWQQEIHDGSILYLGTPAEIPAPIETIHYLNGDSAIHIAR